ncbi:alpha-2-macroglobulin-like protein 1, partial [Rhinophrynus dorsalis]
MEVNPGGDLDSVVQRSHRCGSRQKLLLTLTLPGETYRQTFVTDSAGEVSFEFPTDKWGTSSISLEAKAPQKSNGYTGGIKPRYGQRTLYLHDVYMVSENHVHIRPVSSSVSCHENVTVHVDYILTANHTGSVIIFYLVVVKDRIVSTGQQKVTGKSSKSLSGSLKFSLPVRDVSPAGKMLVFTVSRSGGVAADTTTLHVTPCLKHDVNLKFTDDEVSPGADVNMQFSAFPGSMCAVRVIDSSVLRMEPGAKVTVAKVQHLVPPPVIQDKSDSLLEQCIKKQQLDMTKGTWWGHEILPEKKKDVQDIIKIGACHGASLPASTGAIELHGTIIRHYVVPNLDNALLSGGHKALYNQEIGLTIISNWKTEAPLKCTFMMATHSSAMKATGNADNSPEMRTFFPETWIWDLMPILSSGTAEMPVKTPHSITQWEAQTFCIGEGGFGLGLSPPTSLTVFHPFFVDLTTPYAVKRGETFTLRASVFNYLDHCMQLGVTLSPSEDFQMKDASNSSHNFCLCAKKQKTVTWNITPTKIGQINITVISEASINQKQCSGDKTTKRRPRDVLTKTLMVKPEGVAVEQTHNLLLISEGDSVSEKVQLEFPPSYVQGSEKASVSVFGDMMGSALNNLDHLLTMSYGSGEQNMVLFAPNVFILQYLNISHQLTPEISEKGRDFLMEGYQRQLTYKHRAGCYSAFGESDKEGSTWLTAFVVKCFGQARPYVFIEELNIDQAIHWLVKQQRNNGCFKARGQLLNNALKGGVNDEVSLTAYVVAALIEAGRKPTESVVERGLQCLQSADLNNASLYKLAILTYAFTLANHMDKRAELLLSLEQQAIKSDTDGSIYWSQEPKSEPKTFWSKPKSMDVELTAYVLLSLASTKNPTRKELRDMVSIVRWLTKQQNGNGGFCSTQDTVVALQALSKFASLTFSNSGNVTVTVTTERGFHTQFHVDKNNRLLLQRETLPEIPGDYTVTATGRGSVYVQMTLQYHTLPTDTRSAFSLSAVVRCRGGNLLQTAVEFRYQGERPSSNMAVVEVRMMSGYVPEKKSIEQIKKHPLVKRVESKEDMVTIYVDKVSSQLQTLELLAEKRVKVTGLKPGIVRVYDYYLP